MRSEELTDLKHIRDAIQRIYEYTDGVDHVQFEHEPMRQDAVIRQLNIIVEEAGRLSQDLTDQRP